MKLLVLSSSAGGGFAQWNCNCATCSAVRNGSTRHRARTQSSVAVSGPADGVRDLATLVASLEQAVSAQGLRGDVAAFLRLAAERGWVQLSRTTAAA
jgi:pyrroloquinoline quinone biosynthesis protein B